MVKARSRCSLTALLLCAILGFCLISFGFLHSAHARILVTRAESTAMAAAHAGGAAIIASSAGAGAGTARGAAGLARALSRQRVAKRAADSAIAAADSTAALANGSGASAQGGAGAASPAATAAAAVAAGKWRAQPPPSDEARGSEPAADEWWLDVRPTARPTLERCMDLSWLPAKTRDEIPSGGTQYPQLQNIREMMQRWPRDEVRPKDPRTVADTLCRFDFKVPAQRAAALRYRESELPFIVYNVDAVTETSHKWTMSYIAKSMRTHSSSVALTTGNWKNHFMYWRYARSKPPGWSPPTKFLDWTFSRWLEKAKAARTTDDAIYYYKTSTQNGEDWIWDDIKCWKPGHPDYNFFIKKKHGQRGIHCRFGIPGTIAEAHTDAGRNMVAVLRGARRYMMAPPSQCANMYMDPDGFPSARHTGVNWSETDKWDNEHQGMAKAMGFEAVIAAGDVLFIPSMWVHHIISLTLSAQCNTRSGRARYSYDAFHQCGYN